MSVLVAPLLAAVGALGAAVTNCTIEVVRTEPPEQTGVLPLVRKKLMSGTVIDLVSASIEPGAYRLDITVAMDGVELFLPRYVQFTLEGSSIAGERNIHEGPGVWKTMKQKLRYVVTLPDQPPDFALGPSNPAISSQLLCDAYTMGGVDIYRL